MSLGTLRQVVFELPEDLPYFDQEDLLVKARHRCTSDYRIFPPPRDQYIACSLHLAKYPFESLLSAFEDGDGERIIDLALRYYTGCTVEENIEKAMDALEAITYASHRHAIPLEKNNNSLLGRAYFCNGRAAPAGPLHYSCLADIYLHLMHAEFDGRTVTRIDPPTDRLLPCGQKDYIFANDFMHLAAESADRAAECGVVTQGVLAVARYIARGGEMRGVDVRETVRYKPYTFLWEVFDAREAELAEERRQREEKVARAPNAYTCAAAGCGLIAGKKKSFMRCAGSKDCQRRDWKVHKRYCKPDAELNCPVPIQGSLADAEESSTLEPADPQTIRQRMDYVGPDRAIEVPLPNRPGETVRIHSEHLTPEMMRMVRDHMVTRNATTRSASESESVPSGSTSQCRVADNRHAWTRA
ncbi:hypothetical protein BV20DRAFT_1043598 [Pilatotrama ljubarskyi]|nr:hypothetical protein BV20DRAFT_1043598 [Pilatotrama ljubarskyi]